MESVFVSVVDHGDARNGKIECVQQGESLVGLFSGNGNIPCPPGQFLILSKRDIPRGNADETRSVLVAADVAHQVMVSVELQALLKFFGQASTGRSDLFSA